MEFEEVVRARRMVRNFQPTPVPDETIMHILDLARRGPSAGFAVMLLLLAVVNEGLAAGFAGMWDLDSCRELLGIPEEVTPVGVIPIGYAAPDKRSPSLKRGRHPQTDVIHREQW